GLIALWEHPDYSGPFLIPHYHCYSQATHTHTHTNTPTHTSAPPLSLAHTHTHTRALSVSLTHTQSSSDLIRSGLISGVDLASCTPTDGQSRRPRPKAMCCTSLPLSSSVQINLPLSDSIQISTAQPAEPAGSNSTTT